MTPPDSGEREVCGHRDQEWCCTRLVGHSGDHRYWHMRNPPPSVYLPLPLAQRILAALESHSDCGGCGLLVDELRKVVPK